MSGAVEGFQYSGPAGAGIFDAASKLAVQAAQGELDAGLGEAVLEATGLALQAPTTSIARGARTLVNVADGEFIDATRTIFGGRPNR